VTFDTYLRRNYDAACATLHGFQLDQEMLQMLSQHGQNAALVKSWMQFYGLFQGLTGAERDSAAAAFIEFAAHDGDTTPLQDHRIEALFGTLLTTLHRAVARGWLSATSKLLWCLYPSDIVIYDEFVWRSLVVMQSLDFGLATLPRIGSAPEGTATLTTGTEWYISYQRMVRKIRDDHQAILVEIRASVTNPYPYDIRIIDNLLWRIGNPSQSV